MPCGRLEGGISCRGGTLYGGTGVGRSTARDFFSVLSRGMGSNGIGWDGIGEQRWRARWQGKGAGGHAGPRVLGRQ